MEQAKNVITYINDIPHLDVDGDEFAFPLEFEQDGTKTIAFFHMGAKAAGDVLKIFHAKYRRTVCLPVGDVVAGLRNGRQGILNGFEKNDF